MNNNAIKQIYKFNQEAGLLEQGYEDARECAFPIEEALEGLSGIETLGKIFGFRELGRDINPKELSRSIVGICGADQGEPVADVDRLDKHLDIIVFSLGSIFKLGLNPQEAMHALEIVAAANMAKLGAGTDEAGKAKKGAYWKPPEPELQKILDNAGKD